jgi:hypothetical protein
MSTPLRVKTPLSPHSMENEVLRCFVKTIETCSSTESTESTESTAICDGSCCGNNGSFESDQHENMTKNVDWLSWLNDWKTEAQTDAPIKCMTKLDMDLKCDEPWIAITIFAGIKDDDDVGTGSNGWAQIKFTRPHDVKDFDRFFAWLTSKGIGKTSPTK